MSLLSQFLLNNKGQDPQISLKIVPLEGVFGSFTALPSTASASASIPLTTFLEYHFTSSVVSAVDDFSFVLTNANQSFPFTEYVNEGDIILLLLNVAGVEYTLATGIIDTIDVQVSSAGEIVSFSGRTLTGQLADQAVFTPDGQGIFAAKMTPQALFKVLQSNTRIPGLTLQPNMPTQTAYVGMNPQESKLQVLARYLEPFNALAWSAPAGNLVMGKPNMAQPPTGQIVCNKSQGIGNVMSIKSTRSAATIPNFVIPILSSQTLVANQVSKFQGLANPQPGPSRLARLGHYLHRVITISDPDGNTAQVLNAAQSIALSGGQLSRAQAYGLREIAKENMREILIQAVVKGHLNENAVPYQKDQIYSINFDRDGIDENMYLYEVEYSLTDKEGPRTALRFTRLNTICAGNNFQ